MTEPTPRPHEARSPEPPFHEGLQGFASFCETCSRDGKMDADDCLMLADKFRDASFVVAGLQKIRDDLRNEREALIALLGRAREELRLIHMKDCGATYDTTVRIEMDIILTAAKG